MKDAEKIEDIDISSTLTKFEKIRKARAKQNMDHLHKAIVHIETGIHYPALTAASKELGVSDSRICLVLKGKLRHVRGMTFRYANQDEPVYIEPTEEEKEKARLRAAEFYKNKKKLGILAASRPRLT